MDELLEIILNDTFDEDFNIGIFADVREVLFLDFLEQLFTASISNQQCLGGASSFKRDIGSILKVSNEKISLDDAFNAFVPVSVARNGLSNHLQLRLTRLLFDLQVLSIVVVLIALSLCWWCIIASTSQLREEVGCAFSGHGLELRLREFLGDWLLLYLLLLLRLK